MVYTHSVKEDSLKKKQSNMKLNIDENFPSFSLRNRYLTSYAFQVLSFTIEAAIYYINYYEEFFLCFQSNIENNLIYVEKNIHS